MVPRPPSDGAFVARHAAQLDAPHDIRDYAGHSELSTTDLYVRRGRKAQGITGEPFPALPAALLGVEVITDLITESASNEIEPNPALWQRPQRDLQHYCALSN